MATIFQEGFQPAWEEDLYTELDSSKNPQHLLLDSLHSELLLSPRIQEHKPQSRYTFEFLFVLILLECQGALQTVEMTALRTMLGCVEFLVYVSVALIYLSLQRSAWLSGYLQFFCFQLYLQHAGGKGGRTSSVVRNLLQVRSCNKPFKSECRVYKFV